MSKLTLLPKICVIFLTLGTLPFSTGQAILNATECKSRLSSPRSDVAVAFDGKDMVYIFGGLFYTRDNELLVYDHVHAFNITSDEIQVIATLPRTAHGGKAHYREEYGDVLYLRADGTFLWSFNTTTANTSSVTEWMGSAAGCTLSFLEDGVMAFGGLENSTSIYTLDLGTMSQGFVGELPLKSELSVGLYIDEELATYIFAGELGDRVPQLMRYKHLENLTEVVDWEFPSWRHGDGSAIYSSTDGNIYIVGAVVDNGAVGDGIIKIDPTTGQVTNILLNGVAYLLTAAASVYVPEMNRIYIFGGYDAKNKDRDEIWFIDL